MVLKKNSKRRNISSRKSMKCQQEMWILLWVRKVTLSVRKSVMFEPRLPVSPLPAQQEGDLLQTAEAGAEGSLSPQLLAWRLSSRSSRTSVVLILPPAVCCWGQVPGKYSWEVGVPCFYPPLTPGGSFYLKCSSQGCWDPDSFPPSRELVVLCCERQAKRTSGYRSSPAPLSVSSHLEWKLPSRRSLPLSLLQRWSPRKMEETSQSQAIHNVTPPQEPASEA